MTPATIQEEPQAYHEAVAQVPGSPEGTILDEWILGYQLGDPTLRPAKVIVAKSAQHEEGEETMGKPHISR